LQPLALVGKTEKVGRNLRDNAQSDFDISEAMENLTSNEERAGVGKIVEYTQH
jgi:hypothetical protein